MDIRERYNQLETTMHNLKNQPVIEFWVGHAVRRIIRN